MTAAYDPIRELRKFGYTERESAFLYLVGVNSGYFLRRQFLKLAQPLAPVSACSCLSSWARICSASSAFGSSPWSGFSMIW